MATRTMLRYGSDAPLPAQVPLRAGPLSLVYEAGDLRYVRLGGRELLRRVYAAVRDRNWGTVPGARSAERIEAGPDSFRITYRVEHRQSEVDFRWDATITGGADGALRFALDGRAGAAFLRNRIGLCALLPAELAGSAATVETVGGAVVETRLPELITPDQPPLPFTDMRALAYQAAPGLRARLLLEGDAFELEDQRNWTDASFKIFSTPLRLPFPVLVAAGEQVRQTLTLEPAAGEGSEPASTAPVAMPAARAAATRGAPRPGDPGRALPPGAGSAATGVAHATLDISDGPPLPLPAIGLCLASHGRPLSAREISRLRAMGLSHLRADLDLSGAGYEAALARAADESRALGLPLELALLLPDEPAEALGRLRALLDERRPDVAAWLVYAAHERLLGGTPIATIVAAARDALAGYGAAPIAAGSNADYIFAGRNPPPTALLDRFCTTLNPQLHAFDLASVTETLAAQEVLARSARRSYGLPVAVSPVTLRPRHNPYATGDAPPVPQGELPPQVDPRQLSLYGAGWTVGSIGRLAAGGAVSVTYYETTGWRGVMETEAGSPLPARFPSAPGAVFPLYHALADVCAYAGGEVLPTVTSDPLRLEGLALRRGANVRVLLASYAPDPQTVAVSGLPARVLLRVLDEHSAAQAAADPEGFRARPGDPRSTYGGALTVELPPFAVVRLDGEGPRPLGVP